MKQTLKATVAIIGIIAAGVSIAFALCLFACAMHAAGFQM